MRVAELDDRKLGAFGTDLLLERCCAFATCLAGLVSVLATADLVALALALSTRCLHAVPLAQSAAAVCLRRWIALLQRLDDAVATH